MHVSQKQEAIKTLFEQKKYVEQLVQIRRNDRWWQNSEQVREEGKFTERKKRIYGSNRIDNNNQSNLGWITA